MRRREFIATTLFLPAVVRSSFAQAAATQRMALVSPANRIADMKIGADSAYTIFLQDLQQFGYIEGQNFVIDRYSAEGHFDRYADLAREIVSTRPDVVAVSGTPLTQALMAATSTIAIVAVTGDPIRLGLVSNLAHPGGNVTGVSIDSGVELWGKRLELLAEAVPTARTVLYPSGVANPFDYPGGKRTLEVAQRLGISLVVAAVGNPVNEETLRQTFETITRDQADGIVFPPQVEFFAHRLLIVELVRRLGIPAIYATREQVEAGGLMSYAEDLKAALHLSAQQVAEVLRGGKPAEMPYLQATTYQLVINLKTAKTLGLNMPPDLLARADVVIE